MQKVLIIDGNDARKKSLEDKLLSSGIDATSLSMINDQDHQNQISKADVIIMRDQESIITSREIKRSLKNKARFILTNMSDAQDYFGENYTVLLINHDDSEESLVEKIVVINKNQSNSSVMPIAEDPKSKATLDLACKAAKSNATILICGETGVGKELVARYIHHHSNANNGPFVSVNCAALPENMIEAMLFGYEKGAFTSAINSYVGKFEQAQNGTLLLDEIAEMPLGLQAKLLRVLQEKEIERLGGKKQIKINARIIAATNRDLRQQVAAGNFRSDLFYRLNVIPITCAALRERRLDIIPLAEYLIRYHSKELGRSQPELTNKAKQKLLNYVWPGNVREMENIIQRALIMTSDNMIDENDINILEDLNLFVSQNEEANQTTLFDSKLKENEANVIVNVLKETDGCRDVAAKKLNISPRTLRYKISKLKSIGVKVP